MNYYEILGVPRDADAETLKKAYREKAKQYHPDRNRNDKNAAKKFTKIHHIYKILSDPNRRASYDAKISSPPPPPPPSKRRDSKRPDGGANTDEKGNGGPHKESPFNNTKTTKNFNMSTLIDKSGFFHLFWDVRFTAALGGVLFLAISLYAYLSAPSSQTRNVPRSAPITTKRESPAKESVPTVIEHPLAGPLVLLAAGEFNMGSTRKDEQAHANERPQRKVRIPHSLFIGRYEVTVARFRKFVSAVSNGLSGYHFFGESGTRAK